MNFFKTKQRSPAELVRGLKDALSRVDTGPPGGEVRRRVSGYVSTTFEKEYWKEPWIPRKECLTLPSYLCRHMKMFRRA